VVDGPIGIALRKGLLYVADNTNDRVTVWSDRFLAGSRQTNSKARFKPHDGAVNSTNYATSEAFTIDNEAPAVSAVYPPTRSPVSTDSIEYYLSEAVSSGSVIWERTSGTADATLHTYVMFGGALTAGIHRIRCGFSPSLVDEAVYRVKFVAADASANVSDTMYSRDVTYTLPAPSWQRTGLGQVNAGAATESALYVSAGGTRDSLYCLDLTNGTTKWSFYTGVAGDCNKVSYYYSSSLGKYLVAATAGNNVYVIRDDGSGRTPQDTATFTGPPGTPYFVDQNTYAVVYNGNLTRWNYTTNAASAGWPEALATISTSADPAIYNDEIYVATSNGASSAVYKYDLDGNLTGAARTVGANVSLPILIDQNAIYVTPASTAMYAIDASTWNFKWSPTSRTLSGTNSGPAFTLNETGKIYAAAGSTIDKVSDNGSGAAATLDWSFNATSTVNSGPIPISSSSRVYFGRSDGSYYAITDQVSPGVVSGWPYSGGEGNASTGPWLNQSGTLVIFGSSGGKVQAFSP
jgi:hypothetical protein